MTFADGQRVRIKPNSDEGWEEEFGTVIEDTEVDEGLEDETVVMVQVDRYYFRTRGDDGLREVTADQLEVVD